DDVRPVSRITISHVIVRTIDWGITSAKDFLFRQVDKAIAACVGPSQKMKLYFASAIIKDHFIFFERSLRRLNGGQIQAGNILSLFGRFLPALWLIALHLFSDAHMGQG